MIKKVKLFKIFSFTEKEGTAFFNLYNVLFCKINNRTQVIK